MTRNSYNLAECKKYRIKYSFIFNRRKETGSTLVIAPTEEDARDALNDRLVAVDDLEILEVREES